MTQILSLQTIRAAKGLPEPKRIFNQEAQMTEREEGQKSEEGNGVELKYLGYVCGAVDPRPSLAMIFEGKVLTTALFDEHNPDHTYSSLFMATKEVMPVLVKRISDDFTVPNAQAYYSQIWDYLLSNNLPFRGPLLNARAVLLMRDENYSLVDALDMAVEETKRACKDVEQDYIELDKLNLLPNGMPNLSLKEHLRAEYGAP